MVMITQNTMCNYNPVIKLYISAFKVILLDQLVKINLNCSFKTFNKTPDLNLIVEQADIAKLEIQLSSMESKYVRIYQRLEAVEKCEMCQQQINNGK